MCTPAVLAGLLDLILIEFYSHRASFGWPDRGTRVATPVLLAHLSPAQPSFCLHPILPVLSCPFQSDQPPWEV